MNKKRGITLSTLVIYIALFAIVTVVVSSVSANMNERLFNSSGEAINYTNLNKLQYNLENSAYESDSVYIIDGYVSFSNGDNYNYDVTNKVIYKNGGILCTNVDDIVASIESDFNGKKVTLDVTFNKYLNILKRTIIVCVEVD